MPPNFLIVCLRPELLGHPKQTREFQTSELRASLCHKDAECNVATSQLGAGALPTELITTVFKNICS